MRNKKHSLGKSRKENDMKKININGTEYTPVGEIKYVLRTLRKEVANRYPEADEGQRKLILSAYDNVIRMLYRKELRAAKSDLERDMIMEMPGDFVVYKRGSSKRENFFFTGWDNGEPIISSNADNVMFFDYESKAEETRERLGEGWKVMDASTESAAAANEMLEFLFSDKYDDGFADGSEEDE